MPTKKPTNQETAALLLRLAGDLQICLNLIRAEFAVNEEQLHRSLKLCREARVAALKLSMDE